MTTAFTYTTPILCVDNAQASLDHYVAVLGFEIAWQWSDDDEFGGGTPVFACVRRGEVSIFLGEKRQGNPGTWLMLHLDDRDDVDALHVEYQASGAKILEAPDDMPWGMREMVVSDLDGNCFRIAAPVDRPS